MNAGLLHSVLSGDLAALAGSAGAKGFELVGRIGGNWNCLKAGD
jgi:hypothetical protein